MVRCASMSEVGTQEAAREEMERQASVYVFPGSGRQHYPGSSSTATQPTTAASVPDGSTLSTLSTLSTGTTSLASSVLARGDENDEALSRGRWRPCPRTHARSASHGGVLAEGLASTGLQANAGSYLGPLSAIDRRRETFGPEEARTSASLQSRPSGRRARTLGDGSQQSRLQDRFHTSAWPQGRLEAAHCWKDAFFSRPFAASLQVFVLFFFFFKSTPIRRRKWNTRGPKEDARWSRVLEPIVSTATRVSTRLSCFLRIFLFLSRSIG